MTDKKPEATTNAIRESTYLIEVDDTLVQTLTSDPRWIPDGDMKLAIQLYAFSNAALSADVDLLVDWVLVEAPTFA